MAAAQRPLAFFEAGRAVAGWHRGRPLAGVSVETSDAVVAPASPRVGLFITLAGLAAEARCRGFVFQGMAAEAPTRWADMLAKAALVEAEDSRRTVLVDATYTEVRDMLNTRKVWAAVNAVAGALLARQSLAADELRTIIERTAGDPQRS